MTWTGPGPELNNKDLIDQVNTEARERRRSELKEALLPPIKPRSEVNQLKPLREDANGTNEKYENEEESLDEKKNNGLHEETTKDEKKRGKIGKLFSNFTRKKTEVIEENGSKSESPDKSSEIGSKDPTAEKTKKKVSFFRQFSLKKEEDKENKMPIGAVKADKIVEENHEKDVKNNSTNDEDEDTVDDEEDSETEESETEEERDSRPQSPPSTAQKTENNKSLTVSQSQSDNNRIKSKSCSIL